MPLLAHFGIGFAAKRIKLKIPTLGLVAAAMGPDILSFALFFAPTWFVHGLAMGIVWAVISTLITAIILKYRIKRQNLQNAIPSPPQNIIKTSIFIGILYFSHIVLDFIGWPLSAWFPNATGMPLFFNNTPNFGFGVYTTWAGAMTMDLTILLIGLFFYRSSIKKLKKPNAN